MCRAECMLSLLPVTVTKVQNYLFDVVEGEKQKNKGASSRHVRLLMSQHTYLDNKLPHYKAESRFSSLLSIPILFEQWLTQGQRYRSYRLLQQSMYCCHYNRNWPIDNLVNKILMDLKNISQKTLSKIKLYKAL